MKKKIKENIIIQDGDLKKTVKDLKSYCLNTGAKVRVRDFSGEAKLGFETVFGDEIREWKISIPSVRKQREEVFSKEQNIVIDDFHKKTSELDKLTEEYIKVFSGK